MTVSITQVKTAMSLCCDGLMLGGQLISHSSSFSVKMAPTMSCTCIDNNFTQSKIFDTTTTTTANNNNNS